MNNNEKDRPIQMGDITTCYIPGNEATPQPGLIVFGERTKCSTPTKF